MNENQLFEIRRAQVITQEIEDDNLSRAFAWSRRIHPFVEGYGDYRFSNGFRVNQARVRNVEIAMSALSRTNLISFNRLANDPAIRAYVYWDYPQDLIDILRIIRADTPRWTEEFWEQISTEYPEIMKPITREDITLSGKPAR